MNLTEVKTKIKDAVKNGIIYITGQRTVYPDGLYIVEPLVDDDDDLIFSEFDTFRKYEDHEGNEMSLKGFSLHCKGRQSDGEGTEYPDMEVTADKKIIDEVDKNPASVLLVQTVMRDRSKGPNGEDRGAYQILTFVSAFSSLAKAKKYATTLLEPITSE